MEEYRKIQKQFIDEIRIVAPSVLLWWNERAAGPPADLDRISPRNDFERRWPLGVVAHPRILAIVRHYFLQTYSLNVKNENQRGFDERPIVEGDWGTEDDGSDVDFYLPIDLLVHDIESVAPDVYELVSNLVFVPIGQSVDEEFC